MPIPSTRRQRQIWRVSAHVVAWVPAAYLGLRFATDNLGVNPVETITRILGRAALAMLLLSLACTPAKLVGLRQAVTVRRALGLYALAYAVAHLLSLVGLDYGFDWALIRDDALVDKHYVLIGLACLAILVPLGVTSNTASMRRLGPNWRRLHRLVYVAAILAVVHYAWVLKVITAGPVLAALAVVVLLGVRVSPIRWSIAQRGRSPG